LGLSSAAQAELGRSAAEGRTEVLTGSHMRMYRAMYEHVDHPVKEKDHWIICTGAHRVTYAHVLCHA